MAKKRIKNKRRDDRGALPAQPDAKAEGASAERRVLRKQPTVERRTANHPRRFLRLNVSKRVEFTYADATSFGFTRDISGDGVFLRTSCVIPEGTAMTLRMYLQTDHDPLEIEGRVVRQTDDKLDKGIAVQFAPDAHAGRETIGTFVLDRLENKISERLERRPNSAEALEALAGIHLERGKIAEARATYERVVEREPDAVLAHARLAEIAFDQARNSHDPDDYERALRHLAAADLGAREPSWKALEEACKQALDLHRQQHEERERKRIAETQAQQQALDAQRRQLDGWETSLRQQRQQLDSEQAALETAKHAIEQQRADLRQQQQTVAENRNALQTLEGELTQDRKNLAHDRAQAAQAQAEAQAALARAQARHQALEDERQTLDREQAEQEATLQKRDRQQNERAEQLQGQQRDLEQHEIKLEQRESALEQRESALEQRESALEQRESALEQRESALEQRESALEQRESALEQHDAEREQRKAERQQRAAELQRHAAELGEQKAALVRAQAEHQRAEADLATRRQKLDDAQATLKQERDALEHHRLRSDEEIEARAALLSVSLDGEQVALQTALKEAEQEQTRRQQELQQRQHALDEREAAVRRQERLLQKIDEGNQGHQHDLSKHRLFVGKAEALLEALSEEHKARSAAFANDLARMANFQVQQLKHNGGAQEKKSAGSLEPLRLGITEANTLLAVLREMQERIQTEQTHQRRSVERIENQLEALRRSGRASERHLITRAPRHPPSALPVAAATPAPPSADAPIKGLAVALPSSTVVHAKPRPAWRQLLAVRLARVATPHVWGAIAVTAGVLAAFVGLLWLAPASPPRPPPEADEAKSSVIAAAMEKVPLASLQQQPPAPTLKGKRAAKSSLALSRQTLVDVVRKADKQALGTCLESALKRRGKKSRRGRRARSSWSLVLDWVISPAGGVSQVHVRQPDNLDGQRLADCMANAMGTWKFPSAARSSHVRNYPLTIRSIRDGSR